MPGYITLHLPSKCRTKWYKNPDHAKRIVKAWTVHFRLGVQKHFITINPRIPENATYIEIPGGAAPAHAWPNTSEGTENEEANQEGER